MIYEKQQGTFHISSDTIVVCLSENNCIVERYYAHLNYGDKYMLRDEVRLELKVNEPKEERTKGDILDFIISEDLSWDIIGHPSEGDAEVRFYDDATTHLITSYPYHDSDSILAGIEFIMDMKEMLD